MDTDVVIVGKGIAALVLAFLLKQKGVSHIILDRKTPIKHLDLAETLPPSAMPLLQTTGLKELFEKNSIRKTYGYHSLWGSNQITSHNFYFHHPFKYGLKINKKVLLTDLEKIVQSPVFYCDQQINIIGKKEGVAITFKENKVERLLRSKIIIDATGRNRAVLKQLEISTINFDDNLSFTCHVPKKKHPRLKHDVFVESFKEGWGLVSGLGESQNVVSIFTNQKSNIFKTVSAFENWQEILRDTNYLKYFLTEDTSVKVVGKPANSSRPEIIAGPFFFAVGDAALAFDPLGSHGISNALYTANKASDAIASKLKMEKQNPVFLPHSASDRITSESETRGGYLKTEALVSPALQIDPSSGYQQDLIEIFNAYLQSRNNLYLQEQRWKREPYWLNLTS